MIQNGILYLKKHPKQSHMEKTFNLAYTNDVVLLDLKEQEI